MDLDFATSGNVFQTPSHRPMNSLDWSKSNEIFQETNTVPPQSQDNNNPPAKKERALAPKPPAPNLEVNTTDSSMFSASFPTSADTSFAMMDQNGGVNPGLLFTRPPSSGMEPAPFDPMSQPPLFQTFSEAEPVVLPVKPPKRGAVRRSVSTKEVNPGKRINRASASSPIKPSDRPGLSRSFSEKLSRKPVGKASNLPSLAPATRPAPQNVGRSAPQGARTNGRISPLKNHQRLPSLSSIPETPTPRTQTSVRFTIDSKGRARAETTTVVLDGEDTTPTVVRRRKEQGGNGKNWTSSEDDDSSTDDEPIIIPSRNVSFTMPDPRKPPSLSFHSSQRSVSDQSTSSLGIYYNDPEPVDHDAESEAETVMNVTDASNRGDAASELRKVVESRQKRTSNMSESFSSRSAYGTSSTVTPISRKSSNLNTPSAERGQQIRCVCNITNGRINSNTYLVQWYAGRPLSSLRGKNRMRWWKAMTNPFLVNHVKCGFTVNALISLAKPILASISARSAPIRRTPTGCEAGKYGEA